MIIISNIISFALITYIANSFLLPRYSYKKIICVLFLMIIIYSAINYNGGSPLKSIMLLSLYFIYIFSQFKGKNLYKFLVIIPYFTMQILSELLVGSLINNIPFLKISSNTTSMHYIIGSMLSCFILTLLSTGYVYISKYLKINNLPKYVWFLFILPLITIILLVVSSNNYFILFEHSPGAYIYILLLAFSNLTMIIIFLLAINSYNMKNKLEIAQHKEELVNTKFNLLNQHYNYNFNLLHDLLHTCNNINVHLESSDYYIAKNEINKLMELTYKEFNTIYTNSIILNYIINNNLNTIKENEINIKTVLEYNDFSNLDFNTQFNLFNFLVNFSIECCLKVFMINRFVIIKSKKKSNYYVIQLLIPNINMNYEHATKEIEKILSNTKYSISIKVINSLSVSLLLFFPDDTTYK